MTHLLPINDYTDRLTVTLSCLIVMATLFTQVSTTLPKSAEPKSIDIWMFAHIMVLLLVFVVHVCVIRSNENIKNREKNKVQVEESPQKLFHIRSKKKNRHQVEVSVELGTVFKIYIDNNLLK
ncbi:UNVERIFIED_CONTAM: hypothetical protein GTU68_052828 [Idotea baltica]|nr:hypothetical protein [Idotea baltica]